ncbi:hypothetical protein niasHT_035860 [Heterodera trifolii]|uniref:Uncharacterized protein n=1 Tax=Heterodera trifolii TaxID=157864 RepID=A0ABD2ID30_9BILA
MPKREVKTNNKQLTHQPTNRRPMMPNGGNNNWPLFCLLNTQQIGLWHCSSLAALLNRTFHGYGDHASDKFLVSSPCQNIGCAVHGKSTRLTFEPALCALLGDTSPPLSLCDRCADSCQAEMPMRFLCQHLPVLISDTRQLKEVANRRVVLLSARVLTRIASDPMDMCRSDCATNTPLPFWALHNLGHAF